MKKIGITLIVLAGLALGFNYFYNITPMPTPNYVVNMTQIDESEVTLDGQDYTHDALKIIKSINERNAKIKNYACPNAKLKISHNVNLNLKAFLAMLIILVIIAGDPNPCPFLVTGAMPV